MIHNIEIKDTLRNDKNTSVLFCRAYDTTNNRMYVTRQIQEKGAS